MIPEIIRSSSFFPLLPADAEDSLVIYINAVIVLQGVPDPPVSHIRMFTMDFFHSGSYELIQLIVVIICVIQPFIVCSSGYIAELAKPAYRVFRMLFSKFFYCYVYVQVPCALQCHLLSTASSFFKKSISICCCLA